MTEYGDEHLEDRQVQLGASLSYIASSKGGRGEN